MKEDCNWLERYLKAHYTGFIEGNYDIGCHLYFKDINNFIQNVGRYANVIIMRNEDCEVLLNTRYINRIWPNMSWSLRRSRTNDINYIADKFYELREREGTYLEPLPKVNRFIKQVLGPKIVEQNHSFLKCTREKSDIKMKLE